MVVSPPANIPTVNNLCNDCSCIHTMTPLHGLLYLYCHCGHCVLHVLHASCEPSHLISMSSFLSAALRTMVSASGAEQRNIWITRSRLSWAGVSHRGQKGKAHDSKWNMYDLYWAAGLLINLLRVFPVVFPCRTLAETPPLPPLYYLVNLHLALHF